MWEDEKAIVLQRACREAMKCKLLHDIKADIEVCKLEWWDIMEYIKELHQILDEFIETANDCMMSKTSETHRAL